jgi:hypothetical protein
MKPEDGVSNTSSLFANLQLLNEGKRKVGQGSFIYTNERRPLRGILLALA